MEARGLEYLIEHTIEQALRQSVVVYKEGNPNIEQFWLSFIDAQIKEKQYDHAKKGIEQAKMQGVTENKLNKFKVQLAPEIQLENVNSARPIAETT